MIATTAAAVAISVTVGAEAVDQTVAAAELPDLALVQPSYLVADFAAVAGIAAAEVKAAAVDVATFVVDAAAADGAGAAAGW